MSKTQEKKEQTVREHAEYCWQQAQLKAAMAKTELDLAVETFKDLNKEMTEDQIRATEEQVKLQYQRIEEFLMAEKNTYLERIKDLKD